MRALLNYEAPEIQESGPFTNRSVVYSFGVVMLELLTGRRPYDRSESHCNLLISSLLQLFKSPVLKGFLN